METKVDHQHAARPVDFFHLCAEIEQHPGIHQNVEQPAVQEARRDQAPILAVASPIFHFAPNETSVRMSRFMKASGLPARMLKIVVAM